MKAIMYHYVRPDVPDLPHFRHLHFTDFCQQLDYFQRHFGFISKEQFLDAFRTGAPKGGIVLTFDDGFKDHHLYVLPELKRRGLWAIFYVPSGMYVKRKLLGAHRIHMLLGKYGGETILKSLNGIISDAILTHQYREEFRTLTYTGLKENAYSEYVKRVLNYYIGEEHREGVLDILMERFFPDEGELCNSFYLSPSDLKNLSAAGMIIGSHSVNHPVMSKLSRAQQVTEVNESFEFLEASLGKCDIRTYCHPYGGFHSFNSDTEQILESVGCLFSFNVEPRDIGKDDLLNRRQALPRFDCNLFPYGQVRALSTATITQKKERTRGKL